MVSVRRLVVAVVVVRQADLTAVTPGLVHSPDISGDEANNLQTRNEDEGHDNLHGLLAFEQDRDKEEDGACGPGEILAEEDNERVWAFTTTSQSAFATRREGIMDGAKPTDESNASDDAKGDPGVRLVVALPLARALVRVGALVLVPPACIPSRHPSAPIVP